MPLSSGTRGGSSVVGRKRPRKPKGKKLCELGKSCPYQHEYQHQLEFTHEESTTSTSTEAVRRGGERKRGAVPTGRSLNGTGARGRKLAVAADRRRAERGLKGVGRDLLDVHGGDARGAQRARWVMRMQEQMGEKGAAASAPSGPRPRVRGRDPSLSSNRVPSLSSDGLQLAPSPSCASTPSRHASLPSSLGLRSLDTSSEAAPLETRQPSSGTVGRKRASPGTSNETSNEGGVKGKAREVVCVDCDTDDD